MIAEEVDVDMEAMEVMEEEEANMEEEDGVKTEGGYGGYGHGDKFT